MKNNTNLLILLFGNHPTNKILSSNAQQTTSHLITQTLPKLQFPQHLSLNNKFYFNLTKKQKKTLLFKNKAGHSY